MKNFKSRNAKQHFLTNQPLSWWEYYTTRFVKILLTITAILVNKFCILYLKIACFFTKHCYSYAIFYYRVAFLLFRFFVLFSRIHNDEKSLPKAVKNDTCGIFSFVCCFFTCSVYCVCQKPNFYNFSPPCRAIFLSPRRNRFFVPPPVAKAIYKNKKTVLKAACKTAFCRRLFHRPRAMGDGRWKIRAAGVKSRSRSTVQKQTTFICKISKQTAVKRLLNKYVFKRSK